MKETKVESLECDTSTEDLQARIIPRDLGLASRPFDVSAVKKCYIREGSKPPYVLREVDCSDIIIIEEKFKL